MATARNRLQWIFLLGSLAMAVVIESVTGEFFKPFNVTYDHRALIIDGHRRMLISAGVHYPRATPDMWPDLIAKSKEGGADVIQTYVFWNGHEPIRGQFNFEGRYDLVKFVKIVGSNGLYLHLRIGPYVCAEWNFGGFPVWLRDIPGIEFRTNNVPFKEEMQRFVKMIVDMMREEKLFSWQGGPIIMLQIENEYGDVEKSYGQGGKDYVKWAASMAIGLGSGVPWVMCKQTDAPEYIIDACNGYYCDGFRPNSRKKPALWTEDWDGWYTSWGWSLPHRPVEDLAFAVARFFQRGGSFQNYYMYFGGTNFGRTSGGPFYITSYDYDAPLDEYGLFSQPKWSHLKDLHAAIKLCEPALVAADSAQYVKLGRMQEAHIYWGKVHGGGFLSNTSYDATICSAFIANIDERKAAHVEFQGQLYMLPPWSVSILPDCRNVAFNTAKVGAQTSIKKRGTYPSYVSPLSQSQNIVIWDTMSYVSDKWMTVDEPINLWSKRSFSAHGILEHLNVTKDSSDYLWYFTRVYISDEDVLFWKKEGVNPTLLIDSMRDAVYIFVNGQLAGSANGHWVKVTQPVQLVPGYNNLTLLSLTIGLQNYGAFFEKDGAGFKGQIKLMGLSGEAIDLSGSSWIYQVGLKGEMQQIYTIEGDKQADWVDLATDEVPSIFSWYKTYFDAPDGLDPVVIDLGSMGKGQVWVNGYHLGRYWTRASPKDGCQTCDYRGSYNSNKCRTNCGNPTQRWYHVPRSWLEATDNLLVIFEETGGNPFKISVQSLSWQTVCGQVSETHYPPLSRWSRPEVRNGKTLKNDTSPALLLQCEKGHFLSIAFASYGTPNGGCQEYTKGECHSSNSLEVVSRNCQGRERCSIAVSNAEFGTDPCHGIVKSLAVEAQCIPTSFFPLSSTK